MWHFNFESFGTLEIWIKDTVILLLNTNNAINFAILGKIAYAVIIYLGLRCLRMWHSCDIQVLWWGFDEMVKWIEKVVLFTKSFHKPVGKILVLHRVRLSFSLRNTTAFFFVLVVIQIQDWKHVLRIHKLIKTSSVDVTMKRT